MEHSSSEEDLFQNASDVSNDDTIIQSELESDEEFSDIEEPQPSTADSNIFFYGRDKTRWAKNVASTRIRKHNLVIHLPGPRHEAREVQTPASAFLLFFNSVIINILVNHTNEYINTLDYSRDRDMKPTDSVEIKALIGLLILSGMLKSSHLNTTDLWSNDLIGIDLFQVTMSLNRFHFLLRALRFDDRSTRTERKKSDNLSAVREIVELFKDNCKKYYTPGEYLTIDEQLHGFRGRCSFRQYMPNKPARYGLKIFMLADARTFYVSNLEIYAGKQPEGPYFASNSPGDVVKRLIQHISGTGRNITVDNWYNSIPLARDLLANHNLTIVGTLKKNKKEIPSEFLPSKNRQLYSALFGFSKDITLLSYVPKKSRAVILSSSMHHDKNINLESEKLLPEMIDFYNQTKGGGDVVDQLCSNYNVSRVTNRWPVAILFALLNIAKVNSLVIYNIKKTEQQRVTTRKFLKEMAKELTLEQIKRRASYKNLSLELKSKIQSALPRTSDEVPLASTSTMPSTSKRRICSRCPPKRKKKASEICTKCKNVICKDHRLSVCEQCL